MNANTKELVLSDGQKNVILTTLEEECKNFSNGIKNKIQYEKNTLYQFDGDHLSIHRGNESRLLGNDNFRVKWEIEVLENNSLQIENLFIENEVGDASYEHDQDFWVEMEKTIHENIDSGITRSLLN